MVTRQKSQSLSYSRQPLPPLPPRVIAQPTPDDDECVFDDADGAQAALQPAMSSAASHLTSCRTPAAEKAAALRQGQGGVGFFDGAVTDTEPEADSLGQSPHDEATEVPSASKNPLPSPWVAGPKTIVVEKEPGRQRQSRSVLASAFGPTRHQTASSTGQDSALRKLQKAIPSLSLNMPTHLLPSLPSSFLGSSGDQKQGQPTSKPPSSNLLASQPLGSKSQALPPHSMTESALPSRPSVLRRVTSDDHLLYHSMSRASSLGDDERFHDVREMVNIRFMALKDSLPDVPNFRMPSFAKLQAASRMSSISLNTFFSGSTDEAASSSRNIPNEREALAWTTPFDRALEDLTGDIVILGGYRGSVLRSAEPPHQQLWAPVKLGFNMRKANLSVGLDSQDEDNMENYIIPSGMLKHIGPVDISRKLFKRLRSCPNARSGKLRVWDYGYDWRLSPALLSHKLVEFISGLPCNKAGVAPEARGATVIVHSLGGLITRHAVNMRPHLFAGVLYAGVPQRCINILGPMRNGDAVLFNEKLLTAQVNFSIRTSFLLLPDDGSCFINKETGQRYPVDFFNADNWIKYRLSPCVAPVLPPSSREKQQINSPLTSLFPSSLLRGGRWDKKALPSSDEMSQQHESLNAILHRDATIASQMGSSGTQTGMPAAIQPSPLSPPSIPGHDRYVAYLRRTLAATRKFRAELAHRPEYESSNLYPPQAVLYGKSIPTVFAAQVQGQDAIGCADAYDDLLFRPGDGVVLAREAMLPEGYSLVRGGRVRTERGHLTMLGDLPAVGRALEALVWGRKKGIGLGQGVGSAPGGDEAE
ncbi:hypothetical protein CDD82_1660 [Ophiocordyceps australis]|uniref:Uncharacterized protein n=1 Tax=Ophiocordyceps australis TaxID=1399860 RepID=A0A2C5YD51_9HYPO|nr:hypothetical protein CDD82_1660 [Ophiocordyceps australis]